MGDALLLFNISRPQRLTELSNVTQMASRTLAGNSQISKQEWMKFMEAEFDRLDKDKSGDLDAKDLKEPQLRVSHYTAAGK